MRIGPDGEIVDQRDGSAKAAFCSATATRDQRPEVRNQKWLLGEGTEHNTRGAYAPQSYPKMSSTLLSKQIFELLDGRTSITHNCGHCVGIDWIVAWHHNSYRALRHEDVLPLSIYLEAGLFERFDGAQMIYAGTLRH